MCWVSVFFVVVVVNLQSSFEQVLTAADGITKSPKRPDSLCSAFFILIEKVSTVFYLLCNHLVLFGKKTELCLSSYFTDFSLELKGDFGEV